MSFYAIRQRSTGYFLPALNSYGFTHAEPSKDDPPRLFKRKSSASQALSWWLEGAASPAFEDNISGGDVTIRISKKPNRDARDMEIVVADLTFRTLSEAELARL